LIEVGFEYITEMDSMKLFRKRKQTLFIRTWRVERMIIEENEEVYEDEE
jgi:hypothetical protein